MSHKNENLIRLLSDIDLGSSVAEHDKLLETARVETSAFSDLFYDKVDLIPGTKGSGKSALYRIFVEFLPDLLLKNQKVVIAHGVNHHGDSVFLAFNNRFEKLNEDDFVNFWCIYFVSLVHEQFLKNSRYKEAIKNCAPEISNFLRSCQNAKIPEIKAKKSLRDILEWTLNALASIKPKLRYKLPNDEGEFELDLFGKSEEKTKNIYEDSEVSMPIFASKIKNDLEDILRKSGLNIWLMVDRLDEIFPRRSKLERRALRGLLRTMRIFSSDLIRIKIFLRDDMLRNVVSNGEGFTALTHLTARQADTLRWTEDQILTMIVKRIFANEKIRTYLNVDIQKLDANLEYRREAFYKFFPSTVHKGEKQSNTLRWIYNRTADGNNVVTPRDVIDLLTIAKQNQQNLLQSNPNGESSWVISGQSIRYGLEELSKRKRTTLLEAEFPHLWKYIEKFISGKTVYTEKGIRNLLGNEWKSIIKDLSSIGFLSSRKSKTETIYKIPFIYHKGLELTQGCAGS